MSNPQVSRDSRASLPRRAGWAAGVGALVLLLGGSGSGVLAQAAKNPPKLRRHPIVLQLAHRAHHVVDIDPAGLSAGDRHLVAARVLARACRWLRGFELRNRRRNPISNPALLRSPQSARGWQPGQVAAQGQMPSLPPPPPHVFPLVVTGGTGDFAGALGKIQTEVGLHSNLRLEVGHVPSSG